MKIKIVINAFFLILFHSISAQPIFEKWVTIKEFNAVLSQTFQPAQTGNLAKLQENCDEYTLNACNARGNTALYLAYEYGHDDIVKYLLEQPGIDLNKENNENKKAGDMSNHTSLTSLTKFGP